MIERIKGLFTTGENSLAPNMGDAFWSEFEEDDSGGRKKGVYTDAFWVAPPYGRPRDIDYERLEALEKSVWVRMCVQHIADSVAKAEWNIVPEEEGMEVADSEIDEVKEFFKAKSWHNSFSEVLKAMVPDMLQYDCGVLLKAYRAAAYDENMGLDPKTKEQPVEMYARDGRSFMKDTDPVGILKGYWQYSWFNPQGKPTFFDPREVLYLQQDPQSRSPYGIAKLEVIESIVNYLLDSTEAQSKYWKNGLFVGGVIDHPEVKDISELKRLQKYYESKLRGVKKFNKWLVTGGGAEVKTMPFTSEQMEWLDSQKWFSKVVFSVFKVTPSELGFTEDVNRATDESQKEINKSKAVQPVLQALEEAINREIVWKDFSENVRFQFERRLDLDDQKKQAEIDKIRLTFGLDSVNELRDRDGKDKWEDEAYDMPTPAGLAMPDTGQQEDTDSVSDGEQEEEAISEDSDVGKAANVSAGSGQPGFTPVPETYDESPVELTRNEKRLKRAWKEYYNSLSEEAKDEIRRMYS